MTSATEDVAFEQPEIASDAVLWRVQPPPEHTGRVHTMTELRDAGVVRPSTPCTRPSPAAD
jgi:hypothetical protein